MRHFINIKRCSHLRAVHIKRFYCNGYAVGRKDLLSRAG